MKITKNEIIWSNFGDENNYEEGFYLENYKNIGPFKFNKEEYQKYLLSI